MKIREKDEDKGLNLSYRFRLSPLVSFSRSFKDVAVSYFQNFNCFGYQNLLCDMPLVACHQ